MEQDRRDQKRQERQQRKAGKLEKGVVYDEILKPLTLKERQEKAQMFKKKSTLELFKNYKVSEYRLPSPLKKPSLTRV